MSDLAVSILQQQNAQTAEPARKVALARLLARLRPQTAGADGTFECYSKVIECLGRPVRQWLARRRWSGNRAAGLPRYAKQAVDQRGRDEGDAGVQGIGSAAIDVTPGDYFELIALPTSGATKNVAANELTWLALEVVE